MSRINILFFILILTISFKIVLLNVNCFSRCLTCTFEGNENNHNCDLCKNSLNYYFRLDGKANTCYSKSEVPENYYINSGSLSFEPCHERCQTCIDGNSPSSDSTQCIICSNGLYKKDSDPYPNNCYYPYEIPLNYYKDMSLTTPNFKKCYEKCNTCSQLGDNSNNYCDSCKMDSNSGSQYYKLDSGETGNCFLINEIPTDYEIPLEPEVNEIATEKINIRNEVLSVDDENYVYIKELIARKCYKNCKTCNGFGNEVDMKCITCQDEFYFYKNNCYKKCPKPYTYQLKDSNFQCKELVEGYKIVTEYKTSTDIVNFLLFHGLNEFDFEKDLITANKIFGQIYSLKNKKTNDELAEKLRLGKISISVGCLNKIVEYYDLDEDSINDFILIKFDRNYTNSKSKYKSSVNQIDFYLFYPDYDYDLIAGEKTPNGIYTEIEISKICKNEGDIKIIKPLVNTNETLTGVNVSIALEIYEKYNSYDMYLSSNPFFSDICSVFKSKSGRDVELAERRKKYYQNISFCEGNCIFSGFDYENYKINCDCNPNLFLTSEQYNDKNFKDRKNRIKNLTFSTLSNIFPENTSLSYIKLNLKTMKCTHLTFDINIAIRNIGNWFALLIFITKVVIFGYFLRRKFTPINDEYNKRKQKIEQEFLAQIPDAQIMTAADLARIPKYHIERVVWGNYAGSFKYDKRKKNKKRFGQQNLTDNGEANKFTYNGLLMNRNHVEVTDVENEIEEEKEKEEKKEKEDKKEKKEKKDNNPPKRFGYIYTDDRAEQVQGQHFKNRNQVFKDALKDLNYKEKEKNTKAFFEKGNNKTDFANIIFPLSKEKLNDTIDENEKNTNINSVKKSKNKKRRIKSNDPKKMDEMINEILPIDPDDVVVDARDKITPKNRNENLKFNVAKLNQLINEEYEFKRDQKARKEFNEGKALQEENRQHRNKLQEKNHNRTTEGEEPEKAKNKKKLRKKKFGNQNYLEDPDEVAKYKKEYLDGEDIGENPFRIEPAINYRFSSMTSPEKLTFMNYNYAVDLDRRTFMEIYMGCIKMSQMIFNFIYIPYYHNMKFLKIYFFVFVFNLNLFTTTIFYSHYYILKMYGFKLLICSLQSIFVSIVLYLFSYSKKKFTSVHVLDIWKFRYYKKVNKFIIITALIIEFILSGFIWFLSSSFNAVYQNSFIFYFLHVLESNILTLGLPFLFCFLPALLRYTSLVYEKKALYCINNYVDIIF